MLRETAQPPAGAENTAEPAAVPAAEAKVLLVAETRGSCAYGDTEALGITDAEAATEAVREGVTEAVRVGTTDIDAEAV